MSLWFSDRERKRMKNEIKRYERVLTRDTAREIILDLYIREAENDVELRLTDIARAVRIEHQKRGGTFPNIDFEDITMLALHDMRFLGHAEKVDEENTTESNRWKLSPNRAGNAYR